MAQKGCVKDRSHDCLYIPKPKWSIYFSLLNRIISILSPITWFQIVFQNGPFLYYKNLFAGKISSAILRSHDSFQNEYDPIEKGKINGPFWFWNVYPVFWPICNSFSLLFGYPLLGGSSVRLICSDWETLD